MVRRCEAAARKIDHRRLLYLCAGNFKGHTKLANSAGRLDLRINNAGNHVNARDFPFNMDDLRTCGPASQFRGVCIRGQY